MSDLFEIPDDHINNIISLLNYSTMASFHQDVNNIKEWMKKQPHLPEIMCDKKIQNFLILNRGSVENTKEKIDKYYTIRSQFPHIFDDVNPNLPHMKKNFDIFYFVPFPKLTKEMFRIFIFKLRNLDIIEKYDVVDIIRYTINLQEVRLVDDVTFGDILILDAKDVPLNFTLNFTPTFLYTMIISIYKNVFSYRMKALHIINAPPFVEKVIGFVKLILGQKVNGRIHLHQNYDFLIENFGKEIIPVDYGGEEKSLAELQSMLGKKFQDHEEMFNNLDKLRVREELRPKDEKNNVLDNLQGNFKKLEVD